MRPQDASPKPKPAWTGSSPRAEHRRGDPSQGLLAVRTGPHPEGAALMQRSVEVGPGKPHYLRNMCEVYRQLGR